ncbi:MAG: diguanylate cyclase, partial [Anaerolineaceae bacterium]|nr:diguanylate cyclase [Anaerolineaceae bacterium]
MENRTSLRQSYASPSQPVIKVNHTVSNIAQPAAPWMNDQDENTQPAQKNDLQAETPADHPELLHRLALLHFILDASSQGIMLTDLAGNLVLRNTVLLRLFDLTDQDAEEQEKQWVRIFAGQVKNSDRMLRFLNLILEDKTSETLDIFELKNGRVLECRTRFQMVDQLGESIRLWSFQDCTEQYRRESELQHLSMHDTLTGVYNRAFFEMKLSMFRQSGLFPVAMIMLDVDGLKSVNDRRGHHAGDELLCQVAQILRQACRKEDVSARLGGDEFGLLLAQTDGETADHIIDRIQG